MADLTKGQKAYAARNARAKELGYNNYWALRQATKNKRIVYDKLNNEYIPGTKPIAKGSTDRDPKWKRDGFASPSDYMDFHRENGINSPRVQEIREWIATKSHSKKSELTEAQFRDPYTVANHYRTFVSKSKRDLNNKAINIKEYLVDQMGYMTLAQYKAYKKARKDFK